MTPDEILLSNAQTKAAIAKDGAPLNSGNAPYHGYFTVDLFECPPFTMFTNNDCPRAADILYRRSFEPFSMKLWCRLARAASGIVDMGAHVGIYALAAASLRRDIPIHAIEPNLFALTRLRMHKSVNGFENLREYYCAVAHKAKIVTLTTPVHKGDLINSGGRIVPTDTVGAVNQTFVAAGPLDSFEFNLGNRALLKIDVEGAEGLVFEGMPRTLALRPDIILETFSAPDCDKINAAIAPLGYRVFHILESEGRLVEGDRVRPMDMETTDYNQLLTVHDPLSFA